MNECPKPPKKKAYPSVVYTPYHLHILVKQKTKFRLAGGLIGLE